MEKMSMSIEDYLEAVVELGGTVSEPVRSVDVAEFLDVSKASVSKAVSVLKAQGYVSQEPYGGITLTPEGFRYGSSVLNRHRLLFAFLTQILGVDEQLANSEACKMEHAISDESFEHWIAYGERMHLKLGPLPRTPRA